MMIPFYTDIGSADLRSKLNLEFLNSDGDVVYTEEYDFNLEFVPDTVFLDSVH